MKMDDKRINIDVGIITIKDEELTSVTHRLEPLEHFTINDHNYIYKSIQSRDGFRYNVAVTRSLRPGREEAEDLTLNLIEDLKPKCLFLVGIAGGIPAPEYSLGDVLLCTKLYDFSVCCILEKDKPTFAVSSYDMAKPVKELLRLLPAYREHLETSGWNSPEGLTKERPTIDLTPSTLNERLYGDDNWQKCVIDSLNRNFSEPRKPNYRLGPTASTDGLIKSTSLAEIWLQDARDLANVEMELAGVYQVSMRNKIPVLAIRGLSDIVGFKRSVEWTQFACETAASFAICLIQEGLLHLDKAGSNPVSMKTPPLLSNAFLALPFESPFHPFGTIPSPHASYITRESDRRLEKLLSSHSLICLRGNFCSGKSSLLIRAPNMLSEGWKVFRPMFDLYDSERKGILEKTFFEELQEMDRTMRNWISLSKFLEEYKLAFLLDEIQRFYPNEGGPFIKKLYALVERAPSEHVRVVLTIKDSLNVYIRSIGLDNPKYYNCWETVELAKLNDGELIELLQLFPQPVALFMQENLSIIRERTSMEPYAVQLLCDSLWKHLRGKTIPIKDIDQQIQRYLMEYTKG